ncbi:MAG TPA: photosynthetic complex assembly protein PuhC [Gemmatimonas sp.]|nr:photosynthetic complex assembly protein PuhC [Gemmatimonas sp.]
MSGPIHFEPEPGARPGAPPMRVPKPVLILAASLVAVVFALAISARLFGFGAFREDAGAARVVQQRALKFSDVQGGGIRVLDATTNTIAAELPPGTNGFLRGALRSLTRSRALASIGDAEPFQLTRYADGRLVLLDPATGQHVTISSFGPTQVEAFDRLLR